MDSFTKQFSLSIAIVIIGYLLKRGGYFTKEDGTILAGVVMNFTIPASIIHNVGTITLSPDLSSIILVTLFHNVLLLCVGAILFRKRSAKDKGMLFLLVPGFSLASFTLPLLEGLHAPLALSQVSMLDMGNAPISLAGTYILAYYYSSTEKGLGIKKLARSILRTVPIVTYLVTVFLNVSHIGFPSFVLDLAEIGAKANMPCSFLMLGVALDFHFRRQELLDLATLLSLRYICGILSGLIISHVMGFDPMTRFVVTVGLVAPLPLSAITYTKQFHFEMDLAVAFANATVVVSFCTAIGLYYLLL